MLASAFSLPHISCVRGSPLVRTFLILVVVAAAGFLFVRLTSAPKIEVLPVGVKQEAEEAVGEISARVWVTLSGKADRVRLFANAGSLHFGMSDSGRLIPPK